MENSAKSIQYILENDTYIIPRYQRNYAWGKAEISQLIKDIEEFFHMANSESYYLGSLVCFKRENGSFELIDGQQRHTTITLINLVLKNWQDEIIEIKPVPVPNLKFDSRKKVQNYIESLYNTDIMNFLKQANELNVVGTGSFKDAIEIIQEELREKVLKNFAKNFYENVYLFRVEVPEDTDLNHYFEIMNNRGEQLEKHEIVKALLMGKINNENIEIKKREQDKFAIIWDACSDMNNYIYFNFEKSINQDLFDNEGNLKIEEFEKISINLSENNNKELSLSKIITSHNIPADFPKEEKESKVGYKSIIDFPNFLLQVLKIKYESVSLDDKKLLEQFNNIKLDPKEFIFDLLKYRTLFDKYVIKQDLANANENSQNWGIRKLNTDFEVQLVKTFENDDQLEKLQVMLYYSDSTNTYNNWLQEVLKIADFQVESYTDKVWNIAKGKFNIENLSYPTVSIFNLYFIDFLLWKLYYENIRGKDTFTEDMSDVLGNLKRSIFDQKRLFSDFKFRQLNSKEHLLPQSKATEDERTVLNSIGNLCLISSSQNSSANDKHPQYKKQQFKDDNSSLKRLIMFQSFNDEKWGIEQIEKHKTDIEKLIMKLI